MSVFAPFMAGGTTGTRNPRQWFVDWARGGEKSKAGVTVTPDTALGLSAYYACIRNISEDVGKLPLKVYGHLATGRGKQVRSDHSLYRILHDSPNANMSAMTFRETLTGWAMGWGGGYAEIVRNNMTRQVVSLNPIHPSRVEPFLDDNGLKAYKILNSGGGHDVMPQTRIFDLRGFGDELRGYSVARIGSESIGRAMAVQDYGAAFFGQGTVTSGVFSTDGPLGSEELKLLKKDWKKNRQGVDNAHKAMFLSGGLKWTPMGVNPDEAQLIESQNLTPEDLARWFRVPLHMIGHLLRMTFNNVEHLGMDYVTYALMAWLTRWEQEIKRKLIVEDGIFAEHVVDGLLRGDSITRAKYYQLRFFTKSITPNEIREHENENPLGPEGDLTFSPTNMTSGVNDGSGDANQLNQLMEPITPGATLSSADICEAMSGVFQDAFNRLITKENRAIGNAMKRHKGSDFDGWVKRFYNEHLETYAQAILEPSCSLARLMEAGPGDDWRIEAIVRDMAQTYTETKTGEVIHARLSSDLKDWIGGRGREPEVMAEVLEGRIRDTVRAIDGPYDNN